MGKHGQDVRRIFCVSVQRRVPHSPRADADGRTTRADRHSGDITNLEREYHDGRNNAGQPY